MRLSKEDYRESVGILKRYNYNCLNIINKNKEILGVGAQNLDGMPKTSYNVSDTVFNQYMQLQEDKELQKSLREVKIVNQAILLVNNDSKYIFEELYVKSKSKWQIIDSGMSERTFERRKKELVYTIHKEIKKLAENWRNFSKICAIISIGSKVNRILFQVFPQDIQ